MGNQTSSGPTQTAVEGAANEWSPRPIAAGATRLGIFIFPYAVGFTFAVLMGRIFPASRLDIHPVVWFIGVAAISTLLMIPADRLVRRLVPITGLLTVALGFPDAAPSRFKAAMRSTTTAKVRRRIDAALAADIVEADLDRNQYLLDLVSMLTRHDRLTRGHSERVRAYATLMGEELRLSKVEQQKLYWAALLHDIGKLDVPSEILNKGGRPDKDEWAILQAHPAAAARYLAPLRGWLGDWTKAATEHHLRWDGKGYPSDLGGTDISFAGRMVAIADAYDVMTSARSYKKPMSAADARVELSRCAGGQFDPHLVRAFLNIGLGRVRVAGGVLASLPALVNTVLGGLATNGGRVLLATTAVTGGVAAAPLVDVTPPTPVEVVVETPADANAILIVTPQIPMPTSTPTPLGAAAAPVIVVPATPTPVPTSAPSEGAALFDFDLEAPRASAAPVAAPVVVVPATPTPTAPPTITPVPTATPESFELTVTDDSANAATPPVATATAIPIPTVTREPLLTPAPPTAAPTATATPTPTATSVPTATLTPVPTATATPVPTATSTVVPTATATPVPTATAAPVPTATPTPVPTATPTPVPTATPTPVPTATATPTPTSTPLPTPAPTATPDPACPTGVGCPNAVDDSYGFVPGQRRNLRVLFNDDEQGGSRLDVSTLEILVAPQHGDMSTFRVHNAHVHYKADDDLVGVDSFTYQICNEAGLCDVATVTITVENDTPLPNVCTGYTESTVQFSFDADRRNGESLDGVLLVGPDTELFIFATVPDTTQTVRFYANDRFRAGPPVNVENICPYDLLDTGPDGLATRGVFMSQLGNGLNTVTIVVVDADGSETVTTATFALLITGPGPTPTPTPEPTPIPTPIPPGVGADCGDAQAGEPIPSSADLKNCDLSGQDLQSADFADANLKGANLQGANLTGVNFTSVNAQGANFQNANVDDADFDDANLQGTNWTGTSAVSADFTKARMQGAILVDAKLSDAKFDEAKLQEADLTGAWLQGALLIKAKLENATLTQAVLTDADLSEANLTGVIANLSEVGGAKFDGAILANADFTDATGTPANRAQDANFENTICPDGSIWSDASCWA